MPATTVLQKIDCRIANLGERQVEESTADSIRLGAAHFGSCQFEQSGPPIESGYQYGPAAHSIGKVWLF